MKRRDFNAALMAGGLLAGPAKALASAVGHIDGLTDSPVHLIHDERITLANELRQRFATEFTSSINYDGNFSYAWYGLIRELCENKTATLLGVTRYSDLLIFTTMSSRYGYEIVQQTHFPDHVIWTGRPA